MITEKKISHSQLQLEAQHVIKICRNVGFSDAEVYSLFNEVAQLRQRKWHCSFCKLLMGIITIFVAFIIVLSISMAYPQTEYYINRFGIDIGYPLLRGVRLLSLPLSTRIDITSLYYQDCLLANPFLRTHQDCWTCEDVSQIPNVKVTDTDDNVNIHPFLWKGAVPHDVTMGDLLRMVEGNTDILGHTMKLVSAINTTIQSLDDILDRDRQDELQDNQYIYLLWQVRGSGALKLVWDLSWKPILVLQIAEINPSMFIQVKGSSGKRTKLPLSNSDYDTAWVTQAQGESQIQLSPVQQCSEKCPNIETTMSERDILFFNRKYWELSTIPTGSKVNLQFISTFF